MLAAVVALTSLQAQTEREREEREEAFVLSLDHSKEEMMAVLSSMGVPLTDMRYCSGVMGIPLTFLDKYDPSQFEILGSRRWAKSPHLLSIYRGHVNPPEMDKKTLIHGKETYDRIFIKYRSVAQ